MKKLDIVPERLKEVLAAFNIDANVQFSVKPDYPGTKYQVALYKEFEVPLDCEDPIQDVVNRVQETIDKSTFVKYARADLKRKIETLEAQVGRLEDEVKELKKYETHFNLEKELRRS